MRRVAVLASLSLAVLAPAPAFAADPIPGMVETGGGLRHAASGVNYPKWLKGLRRNLSGGESVVAIYTPSSPYRRLQDLHVGVAVGPAAERMDRAKLSRLAWTDMGKDGVPVVIAETSFAWEGHPEAITFHGAYFVGDHRKSYWIAWDNGWNVFVTATTSRDRDEKMGELSVLIAKEILGGATLAPARTP
jgi:hypothetical protein